MWINITTMSSNNAKPPESVINAIMKNDVALLKQLREAGENFAFCDEHDNTLLHLAVLTKSERKLKNKHFNRSHLTRAEAFDYLLTLDEINKDAKNDTGNTALLDIFEHLRDSPNWAIELIKSGCDISGELNRTRMTALHWAIRNNWDEVAELLIENGCEIDSDISEFSTPLRLACELGFVDLIWMLLFYGADPNKGRCFDLVIRSPRKNEVNEIFESLVGYEKVFNLSTYLDAMEKSPELFYKLCDANGNIMYTESELHRLYTRLRRFSPQLFKMFVQRYDSVVRDMFKVHWYEGLKLDRSRKELEILATNIFTLFHLLI